MSYLTFLRNKHGWIDEWMDGWMDGWMDNYRLNKNEDMFDCANDS